MKQNRPLYEGLDQVGYAVLRPAWSIWELPTPASRLQACEEATGEIARMLGLSARRLIAFGLPAHAAFMIAPEARNHPQRQLLETRGCDLSLDLCPLYYPEPEVEGRVSAATRSQATAG